MFAFLCSQLSEKRHQYCVERRCQRAEYESEGKDVVHTIFDTMYFSLILQELKKQEL